MNATESPFTKVLSVILEKTNGDRVQVELANNPTAASKLSRYQELAFRVSGDEVINGNQFTIHEVEVILDRKSYWGLFAIPISRINIAKEVYLV